MQFWRISAFPLCLNFVTISKDLLVTFMFWFCLSFRLWDMNTKLYRRSWIQYGNAFLKHAVFLNTVKQKHVTYVAVIFGSLFYGNGNKLLKCSVLKGYK
jgi:hypothetical protein